jgi:hypothetical protein
VSPQHGQRRRDSANVAAKTSRRQTRGGSVAATTRRRQRRRDSVNVAATTTPRQRRLGAAPTKPPRVGKTRVPTESKENKWSQARDKLVLFF